jgi:hypothetical protein
VAQIDQSARFLIKNAPEAFLRWAAPGLLDVWRFSGFADTRTVEFPGEPERTCDTVIELVRRGGRLLLDVEAQATPHPDMVERLGEYTFRLRRELRSSRRRFDVACLLLTLTGPRQTEALDTRQPELGDAGMSFRVAQVVLREQSAAAVLLRAQQGQLPRQVLPWIPLMQGGEERGIIRRWRGLAHQEPDARWRADYGALAKVFAQLAEQPLWAALLEDWDMKESSLINEWIAQGEKTGRARGQEEGRRQGQEEGRQQGREEGQVQGRRDTLLRAVAKRFSTVPADVRQLIENETRIDELDRLLDAAVLAPSLEVFRQQVSQ